MVRWSRNEITSANSSLAPFLETIRWEDSKLERSRCLLDTLYAVIHLDPPFFPSLFSPCPSLSSSSSSSSPSYSSSSSSSSPFLFNLPLSYLSLCYLRDRSFPLDRRVIRAEPFVPCSIRSRFADVVEITLFTANRDNRSATGYLHFIKCPPVNRLPPRSSCVSRRRVINIK